MQALYIQGIESYLSEPVNCTEELLHDLFVLLCGCKELETIRQTFGSPTKARIAAMEKLWPSLLALTNAALPTATKCLSAVEATIEKMKPLY